MKFTYTLEEDDLKEYYQEALKNDKQIRGFRWKLRIAGLVGGAAVLFFNKLDSKWLAVTLGLMVLWELIVDLILFPGYIKRVSKPMLEAARGTMQEMTLEVTDKFTSVDGRKKMIIDCAVFPTLVVLILSDKTNVIIPNRVLDNDVNVLNELVDTVEKQMMYKAQQEMKKKEGRRNDGK